MKVRLGKDTLTHPELKAAMMTPRADGSPMFQFPNTWDLEDPTGHFQSQIEDLETFQAKSLDTKTRESTSMFMILNIKA